MALYWFCLILHLLAMSLWLGHMLAFTIFVGPANKRLTPPELAEKIRSASLWLGGLGWPALALLLATGLYLLSVRGISIADLVSGAAFALPGGQLLALKLLLVAWMVLYQAIFGHRPAPVMIWTDIAAALLILALSAAFVRGLG